MRVAKEPRHRHHRRHPRTRRVSRPPLLLCGVHMVQTGVERTFGAEAAHFLAGRCATG
jgi:hypothetical protein